ncbi:MAG: gamma-glutamylcyclotransferase family protein [Candidatus Parvarchaeum sp.]
MYYFAYGSNLKRSRLHERVGNWSSEGNCLLDRYRLTFDSRGKAGIIEDSNSKVYGVIYKLSEEQMKKLDVYEGVPLIYKRSTVYVKIDTRQVEAVAYIRVDTTKFSKPCDKYLKYIIDGLHEHGFGEEIIEEVKHIAGWQSKVP